MGYTHMIEIKKTGALGTGISFLSILSFKNEVWTIVVIIQHVLELIIPTIIVNLPFIKVIIVPHTQECGIFINKSHIESTCFLGYGMIYF